MCNIWKEKNPVDLEPSVLKKLPGYLKEVGFSGGEPFLRNDLPEIIEVVNQTCNFPKIAISTNGSLTDKIIDQMSKIKNIAKQIVMTISIDGIGKIHDEIRGIPGTYDRAIDTIQKLKRMGIEDLRIEYVAQDKNIDEFGKVYLLAKELGVEFTWTIAQNLTAFRATHHNFLSTQRLKEEINKIMVEELRSFHPRKVFRNYFTYGMYQYLCTGRRLLPCNAGTTYFFISPTGELCPCNNFLEHHTMGNLKDSNFEDIWDSARADKVRKFVHKCHQCWMICSTNAEIKKYIFKTGMWVLKNKIKAHLGMQIF
jgi:radical SAM protein with 4Fe4S-binding SPASM domain